MTRQIDHRLVVVAAALATALAPAGLASTAIGPGSNTLEETSTQATDATGGFQTGLVDALLDASATGDTPLKRAMNAADAALAHHLDDEARLGTDAAQRGLEVQRSNLDHARRALDIAGQEALSDMEESIRLAQLGLVWQMTNLDLEVEGPIEAPAHGSPSEAIAALADRHDVRLDADTREDARALDELEPRTASALTDVLDAFLGLETAAEELALETETAGPDSREALERVLAFVEPEDAPTTSEAFEALAEPAATDLTVEPPAGLGDVFVHRIALLEATLELDRALDGADRGGGSGALVDEAGLLRIALSDGDTHYEDDYRFVIDADGENTYHNNAGGTNLVGGSCLASAEDDAVAAALIDLSGQDSEFGDPNDPYFCGSNGGGFGGGFEAQSVGVGLLVSDGGDDTYTSQTGAANGGGWGVGGGIGLGLAVDAAGNDTYASTFLGANGGGAAGFFADIGVGVGLLVDGGGDDVFESGSYGTNGGAIEWGVGLIHGGLISAGGDDVLEARFFGTNGGVYTRAAGAGHGFIVNADGANTYAGGGVGSNGGAHARNGAPAVSTAFLLDGTGGNSLSGTHQALNGGARWGSAVAMLVSGPGSDTFYTENGLGANGGAHRGEPARAFLVNAGGDNAYLSDDDFGVNGGAHGGGNYGLLYDLTGDDTYIVEDDESVNGGVSESGCLVELVVTCASSTVGTLLDGSGTDTYEDDAGGTGTDKTVVPKGTIGAQIDLPPSP